jgi:superfamily II DNA or RNA helicase
MVTATLTNDNKWICLTSQNDREICAIRDFFTKKIPNWFIIRQKNPHINIEECFVNGYNMIPVGLWVELIRAAKKFGLDINFVDNFNERITDNSITTDSINDYISHLYEKSTMKPKDYQTDAVCKVLRYKKCCIEVSTSGGKTFISYMIFRYMIDVLGIKHILFVTPKTNLTTQSADKWLSYDEANGIETTWTHAEIHASAKKKKVYDDTIVFGNYQSLCKKNQDFFNMFDAIIIDECHHSTAKSIINITKRCANAQYKLGMTGTFPKDDTHESYVLQSYLGPVVYRLSSSDLIYRENFATPVYVTSIELKYLPESQLKKLYNVRLNKPSNDSSAGGKIYNAEKELARADETRFNFICDMISKTTKNTLVIFSDIKTGYGSKVYNRIKDTTRKHVYYIDGCTPVNARETIISEMESDTDGNTILVASMGCFSEGIDIGNLWNIFLIETTKSDTMIAQLLGRGMRRFKGKDKTIMIDFVDDYRYGDGRYSENYLYRHGKERVSIYKKRGFPLSAISLDLRSKTF